MKNKKDIKIEGTRYKEAKFQDFSRKLRGWEGESKGGQMIKIEYMYITELKKKKTVD